MSGRRSARARFECHGHLLQEEMAVHFFAVPCGADLRKRAIVQGITAEHIVAMKTQRKRRIPNAKPALTIKVSGGDIQGDCI